jgi:PAS domain S-box-containing protein
VSAPPPDARFHTAAFRGSADAILVVDTRGRIVAANDSAAELLATDELLGAEVEEFVPQALRPTHHMHREQFVANGSSRRMGAGLDLVARSKDGKEFAVDIALSPVTVDGEHYVVASLRDVSAFVEARAELEASRAKIAIMEDRQRIARDLHDTVIQDIFAAGLGLRAVQAEVEQPDHVGRLGVAVEQLDAAIARLRRVIFDLRARAGIDVEGTILNVVDHAAADSDLEIVVDTEGPLEQLSARVVEHLVATVREAMANVVRHADATRADILVRVHDGQCCLEVRDDGRGMAGTPSVGFGLDNMANRAAALGGGFEIADNGGKGSRVRWCVPVSGPAPQTRRPASRP